MLYFRFSAIFWGFLILLAVQLHSGYSLFLGHKKEFLKHKLLKLKEALLSDDHYDHYDHFHHYDDDDDIVHHYHITPIYYKKYHTYSSWPSYKGWSHY